MSTVDTEEESGRGEVKCKENAGLEAQGLFLADSENSVCGWLPSSVFPLNPQEYCILRNNVK